MTGRAGRRRAAYGRGRGAERWAALWLRLKGYRILARGFRVAQGEIDLIARRGRLVIFVEVKRRDAPAAAAEAIGGRQRRRIERAAEAFLQRHPGLAGCRLRFDAVLLSRRRLPRHLADAWRP
ncbi:MAG: YraN family protein [Tistlia sp.]|uniref:YraN family protein n=1 Tax=Tistlia sp. TaxID=3057121 RepID=UPI0034A0DB19